MYDDRDRANVDLSQQQNYYEIAVIKDQIAQQRYFGRLRLCLIFILVASSVYLLDQRPESLSIDKSLLALGITWLSVFPSIQYLSERNRPPIPVFPLVGLFYATSFGLPMFASNEEVSGRLSWANVSDEALVLVLLGILGMNIAFYVSRAFLWQQVFPIRLPRSYSLSKLLSLLWLLLVSHIALIYIPFIQKIPSVGQLLGPAGYVAYGIFYILWSRGHLPSFQAWILLLVCVPLEIIRRFSSGLLAEVMILGLFMVLIIWYECKRIPVFFITITMLIYLTFNPVKAEFRHLTWFDRELSHASPIEKVYIFIDLAVKHYQSDATRSQANSSKVSATDQAIKRSALILLFADVMEKTPTVVPYWNGETYLHLLTSFIPRALWPDKPIQIVGNQFGHRYNYLDNWDNSTSINLPVIVEMYANFGIFGVLIGMPLLGLFLAFLDKKLNSPEMQPVEVVIGTTVFFPLIYQETHLAMMIGNVATLLLALYVVFRYFLRS